MQVLSFQVSWNFCVLPASSWWSDTHAWTELMAGPWYGSILCQGTADQKHRAFPVCTQLPMPAGGPSTGAAAPLAAEQWAEEEHLARERRWRRQRRRMELAEAKAQEQVSLLAGSSIPSPFQSGSSGVALCGASIPEQAGLSKGGQHMLWHCSMGALCMWVLGVMAPVLFRYVLSVSLFSPNEWEWGGALVLM